MPAPIGTKLRQQRKLRGLLQADLARAAGISPSYLNLIENNKRQVGGALLLRIASELGIEVEELSGEKEQRLLDELSELLSDPVIGGVKVEPGQLHDLVAQLPTVAQALHRLYRGYVDASASVETFVADMTKLMEGLGVMTRQMSEDTETMTAAVRRG